MYGTHDIRKFNQNLGNDLRFVGCPIVEKSDGLYYVTATGLVQFKKK